MNRLLFILFAMIIYSNLYSKEYTFIEGKWVLKKALMFGIITNSPMPVVIKFENGKYYPPITNIILNYTWEPENNRINLYLGATNGFIIYRIINKNKIQFNHVEMHINTLTNILVGSNVMFGMWELERTN